MIATAVNSSQTATNTKTTTARYRELLDNDPKLALDLAVTETDRAKLRMAESRQVAIDAKGRFIVRTLEGLKELGAYLASSQLVPQRFQNKPSDCALGANMAQLLGLHPLMVLQSLYLVHGTPGIEGKLLIAIINASGQIDGVLDFEHQGEGDERKCRAYAKLKATEQTIYGPWVTWKMVVGEGWSKAKKATGRNGAEYTQPSKWETMPDLMFEYRAGAFFARTRFPHLILGLQTREELEDVSGYSLDDAGLTGQPSARAAFVATPTLPPLVKPLPAADPLPPAVVPPPASPPVGTSAPVVPAANVNEPVAQKPAETTETAPQQKPGEVILTDTMPPEPQPQSYTLFSQLMSRLDRCRTGQGVTRILELAQQGEEQITDEQFVELKVAADKKSAAFISA